MAVVRSRRKKRPVPRSVRLPPHEAVFEIAAAFAAIKVQSSGDPDEQSAVSQEDLMEWARELWHLALPREQPPSRSETRAQLADLRKSARAMYESLARIAGPAFDALAFRGRRLGKLREDMEELDLAAAKALAIYSERGKGGRQVNERERDVAAKAAECFVRITGKNPSRTIYPVDPERAGGDFMGEFTLCLAKIFKALQLKASAAHYARYAIGVLRQRAHDRNI